MRPRCPLGYIEGGKPNLTFNRLFSLIILWVTLYISIKSYLSLYYIYIGENRASCLGIECSSSPNRAASTMELVCCGELTIIYVDIFLKPENQITENNRIRFRFLSLIFKV